jgi:tetratricopeptide (TPR) repeat protein
MWLCSLSYVLLYMKKSLFALAIALFTAISSIAQQDGAELAKNAGKALAVYNIDPAGNAAKLEEARNLIEKALKTPVAQRLASAWLTKGDIYNTRLQKDVAKSIINPKAGFFGDNDALVAFEAYKNGYRLSQSYEKSACIKGIMGVQGSLINIGLKKYEASEYQKSFLSFLAALESHDMLKANGQKSLLDEPGQLETFQYTAGLTAMLANRCTDAIILFNKLYTAGTDKPELYEGLYKCRLQMGDEAGAGKILTEGRKKFPDNTVLLFAEINVFMKAGRLTELTWMLEEAIKKEPDNISLYVTLGQVYDNLYQTAQKENAFAKATSCFDNAKKYFTEALMKEPENPDATYSLGSLYYNKAAFRTQQLNALPEDYSAEGIKKYTAIKNEIMGLFDQALPYFKKSESIDPNDINTLIALSEIFARKEDEETLLAIKKRRDIVKAGGKNQTSYFK